MARRKPAAAASRVPAEPTEAELLRQFLAGQRALQQRMREEARLTERVLLAILDKLDAPVLH